MRAPAASPPALNAPPDIEIVVALVKRVVTAEYGRRDGDGDTAHTIHERRGQYAMHSHSDSDGPAGRPLARAPKADGSWVTAVDRRTQARLRDELARRWPQFDFIGEEMAHAEQHAVCARQARGGRGYWILDPLDGTTNFTAGFPFYGVSLALVADGRAQLGVVFDPVRDECFSAVPGGGAHLNGARLACARHGGGGYGGDGGGYGDGDYAGDGGGFGGDGASYAGAAHTTGAPAALADCIAIVDYKRLVADLAAQLVAAPPYRSQRNLGASALEWCWLAAGRAQLYLHGGQKVWDFAAGHLILTEAGGRAISLSGNPLDCVRLRKRSIVAATAPALLTQWHDWLRAHSPAPGYSPL